MQPDERETYANGDASLTVDRFNSPPSIKFWVGAKYGSVQFTEEGFDELLQMLNEYERDSRPSPQPESDLWLFLCSGVVFGLILGVVLVLLTQGALK